MKIKSTRYFIIALFLMVFCATEFSVAQLPYTDPTNNGGWVLNTDVSDEFEAGTLNQDKWFIQGAGGVYRSNFIGRAPSQFSTNNAIVQDNKLKILIRWEPTFSFSDKVKDGYAFGKINTTDAAFTCPVTTAAVIAKTAFQYGYMEINCKSADASVTSAFWALGSGAEFDVFENLGKPSLPNKTQLETEMWSSIHDWSISGGPSVWTQRDQLPFRVASGFHTWGVEWDPDYLKFYADGQLIRYITKEDVVNHPNAIAAGSVGWVMDRPLNLWVDSEIFPWHGLPSQASLPVDYEIEYIRVWQKGATTAVTGISLLPTSLSVSKGLSTNLTATVVPSSATNKSLSWTSDNSNVATVNANGVVTAVNIGTAIITAKTNDGNFTASCNVNVTNSVAGTTNTYEAEDFTAKNGCTFKTQFAGFSGTGYMKYSANGDWIEWNNVAGTGGTSNLKFTYAAANTNPSRPCEVLVNDVYAGTLTFTNTSSWTTYSTETVSALLVAGNNTVRVKAISAEGGPDLDKMDVTTYTTGIVDTFSSNYVKVYQNKISRTISIELAQDFNVEVEIYDINAKSVFNKKYDATANIHINTLNLNMRDGMYFVSIKNENSSVVKKLMFKL